ncbi:hypothetical protein AB4097_16680 [Microvirga sp. 2MCAF35]
MDEFIAFVRHGDGPATDGIALLQVATELRRRSIGSAPGTGGIRQIDPFLIPNEPISGTKMEIVAGHVVPSITAITS